MCGQDLIHTSALYH